MALLKWRWVSDPHFPLLGARRNLSVEGVEHQASARPTLAALDRLLQLLHANKPELLMVLTHPEIPLHTNGSENDIRCQSLPPRRRG
jgi:hypothetical protein